MQADSGRLGVGVDLRLSSFRKQANLRPLKAVPSIPAYQRSLRKYQTSRSSTFKKPQSQSDMFGSEEEEIERHRSFISTPIPRMKQRGCYWQMHIYM